MAPEVVEIIPEDTAVLEVENRPGDRCSARRIMIALKPESSRQSCLCFAEAQARAGD